MVPAQPVPRLRALEVVHAGPQIANSEATQTPLDRLQIRQGHTLVILLAVDRIDPGPAQPAMGAVGPDPRPDAICGLLRPPARIVGGTVRFDGQELTAMAPEALNRLRGAQIAMVVQNPRTSLDPLTRVGDQLVRIHQAHSGGSLADSRARALEMMRAVGIPDPQSRARDLREDELGRLAALLDKDYVKIRAGVAERYLGDIRVGTPVTITFGSRGRRPGCRSTSGSTPRCSAMVVLNAAAKVLSRWLGRGFLWCRLHKTSWHRFLFC